MTPLPVIEAEVDFHVKAAEQPCKTWYTIFGTFPSPTGIRPLICLHGGPGVPHDCLRPMQTLSTLYDIPIIMYDQLGCGRSTHLPEKKGDESFWTPKLFLLELDNLLLHLGIQDDYDLLGQSWGGCLAADHAILQPKGLKRLILASTPASKPLMVESVQKLLSELPPDIQATLIKHEAEDTLDDPEYKQAKMFFYSKHMLRVQPPPPELITSLQYLQEDNTVNFTMNGPYVFKRIGSTKDWSIIDHIHEIKVPTLLINGKYDGVLDSAMEPFFKGIEKVKWVRFGESSHMPQFEEPEEFLKVVGGFLTPE